MQIISTNDTPLAAVNYEKLEENIVYFEGIIPNYQKVIDAFERTKNAAVTDWKPWYAGDNTDSRYGDIKHLSRKELSNLIDPIEKDRSSFIIDTLVDSMVLCAQKYAEIFSIDPEKVKYAGEILKNDGTIIGIYKYLEDAQMGPHVDWNDKNNYLEYTIVVYLNDDYVGGELYFNEFDIKLKPKAGSIVMYPSVHPYIHESLEILSGRKCLITHHWRNNDF